MSHAEIDKLMLYIVGQETQYFFFSTYQMWYKYTKVPGR